MKKARGMASARRRDEEGKQKGNKKRYVRIAFATHLSSTGRIPIPSSC